MKSLKQRGLHQPPPGEEYEEGFCLMCKGTGYRWNEKIEKFGPRICSTCGGSGTYPDYLMKHKEE